MAIPTVTEVEEFKEDLDDAEAIVNGSTTVSTRLGGSKQSLTQLLASVVSGPVTTYSALTQYTDITEWVEESGVVYRPLPSALPIGPAAFDSSNWIVVQSLGAKVYHTSLLTDVKTLALDQYQDIVFTGDVTANTNIGTLYRRSSFDDAGNAGADAEILGGTLFAYDINGAAFVDTKESIKKRTISNGKLTGKHVHIYRWGSPYSGNDWCFVRTPPDYNPSGAPHPFVILNHGNGWIMDGTEEFANFSSKTQFGVDPQNGGTYLDTGRVDYVEYSSPMIEAFLDEGYIVCGAQNAGDPATIDAGYGNREVQQNIMFFYQHVTRNYNVKDHCHMIGASNGSIATLNATVMMGRDRVRSIILLYPLINLYEAWIGAYETDVATAYGFSADPTNFNSFVGGTRGYNPMVANTDYSMTSDDPRWTEANYQNTNFLRLYDNSGTPNWLRENRLVNSAASTDLALPLDDMTFYRRSIFPWPRIRCHYSLSDTVTPPELHWLAFQKLLERGGHVNFQSEVTGSHGDYTHFELLDGTGVAAMIAWTKL